MIRNSFPWGMLLLMFMAATVFADEANRFSLTADSHGWTLKTPDGRQVFSYMAQKPTDTNLTANSVCCLYPVRTPDGTSVVEFAPADHPHHRGVFLTWHAIDGQPPADFWGWGEWAPTEGRVIVNQDVKLVDASVNQATIAIHNNWMVNSQIMIEERTSIMTAEREGVFTIDLDYVLKPNMDVTLRQTAFGGLCAKCIKSDQSYYSDPKGRVDRPAPHHLKPETDWPPQPWYNYTATHEDGNTCGITIVDHPNNPPTRWHNLQAIAMLNPCIVASGAVDMQVGQPLRLRYRLIVHDGPPPMELLKKLANQWRSQELGWPAEKKKSR